ncbi:MAG: hypothetical protein U0324_19110 [Polyangiales bacterium]
MRSFTLAFVALASLTSACLGPVVQHATPDGAAPDAAEPDAPAPPPPDGGPSPDGGLRQCTAVGCSDSVRLPGVLTLAGSDMTALSLRLCRNDVCATGSVTQLPVSPGTGLACELSGNPEARCTVWATEDGRYRLDLGFGWQTNLRDGDRYELRVLHVPTGTVLAEAVSLATYATSTPNGPGCEPTCQTATLTVTRREIPPTTTPVRDAPGMCFEIFPGVVPTTAAVTPPRAYANPLTFDLTAAVGEAVTANVRYYNFCGEPTPRLIGIEATAPDGGPIDPAFTVESIIRVSEVLPMSLSPQLSVRFVAGAPGTYRARVRYRFVHGYYESLVTVVVRG